MALVFHPGILCNTTFSLPFLPIDITDENPIGDFIGENLLGPLVDKVATFFNTISLGKFLPVAFAQEINCDAPSKEKLIACFKTHAYTRASYSKEPKFYEDVAAHFGGKGNYADWEIEMDLSRAYESLRGHYSFKEITVLFSQCAYVVKHCN